MRHPNAILAGSAVALLAMTGAARACPEPPAAQLPANENASSEAAASPRTSDEDQPARTDQPITMDSNDVLEK